VAANVTEGVKQISLSRKTEGRPTYAYSIHRNSITDDVLRVLHSVASLRAGPSTESGSLSAEQV